MGSDRFNIFVDPFGLIPSGREVFEAFLDVPISTYSVVVGIVFWLILLSLPLSGIDRRDHTSGLTYALFMCFCGTSLMIAITPPDGRFSNIIQDLVLVLVIFVIAKLRWVSRKSKLKLFREISTEEGSR